MTGGEPAMQVRLLAPETLRLYASDWQAFAGWCRSTATPALPASPAAVEAFLTGLAATLRAGSLRRRLAAIAHAHQQAGYPAPDGPQIRARLRARRPRRPVAPRTTSAQLTRAAVGCPGDPAGLRDRALLLLLANTGLGRPEARQLPDSAIKHDAMSELPPPVAVGRRGPSSPATAPLARTTLLGLDVERLRFTREGLELTLIDGDAATGRSCVIELKRLAQFTTCPVHALEDWLRASGGRYGPVFRKVDRWGNVEHHRLHPSALRTILLRRVGATAVAGRGAPAVR